MNEFDRRWQDCAARARQEVAGSIQVPVGFATRAWAHWTAQSKTSSTAAWLTLSFRALVLATAALAVLAVTEFHKASASSAFAPHVEDVVADVWRTL